jgi:dienelactone hydrolase
MSFMTNKFIKRVGLSFAALFLGCQIVSGQTRYLEQVFSNFTKQSDIKYGQAKNENNQMQDLKLDIFLPDGDTETNRPVLILAHGGSFIGGNKEQEEVARFCKDFAKHGYVTASIQYRLANPLSFALGGSQAAINAAVSATMDGKAAVRFFRKSVAEDGNPYGIDPNRIYIGGSSAGGFLALHLAYLSSRDQLLEYGNADRLDAEGGPEGSSGNPGYSSNVQGVVNLCGALGKANWYDKAEPPLISVHGTVDGTVPYKRGLAANIARVEGSYVIDSLGKVRGLDTKLLTFPGADHVPYANGASFNQYYDSTFRFVNENLYQWQLRQGTSRPAAAAEAGIRFSPNPCEHQTTLRFSTPTAGRLTILDGIGKTVFTQVFKSTPELPLSTEGLPTGVYSARIEAGSRVLYHKLVVR